MRDLPGANRADARSDPRLLGERPAAYAARAVQGTEGLRLLQREPRRGRQPPDHPGRVLEARGVHRAAVLAVALLAAAAGAGLLGDEHLGVLAARAVHGHLDLVDLAVEAVHPLPACGPLPADGRRAPVPAVPVVDPELEEGAG